MYWSNLQRRKTRTATKQSVLLQAWEPEEQAEVLQEGQLKSLTGSFMSSNLLVVVLLKQRLMPLRLWPSLQFLRERKEPSQSARLSIFAVLLLEGWLGGTTTLSCHRPGLDLLANETSFTTKARSILNLPAWQSFSTGQQSWTFGNCCLCQFLNLLEVVL